MNKSIIKKASYQILEDTISLYLGLNEENNQYDIIRIMTSKNKNINSLEEYLNCPNKKFEYKIFISVYINIHKLSSKYSDEINIEKFFNNKLNNIFNISSPVKQIIIHKSPFKFDNYGQNIEDCMTEDEIDENYVRIIYDGYIITNEDLLLYIVNILNRNKITINEESYLDDSEKQLCKKF